MSEAESQAGATPPLNGGTPPLPPLQSRPWFGWAIAVVAVGLGTLARWALDPILGAGDPYVTFFPAIAIAVFFGRLPAGLLAMILSSLAADFLFLAPRFRFGTQGFTDASGLILFLGSSGLIVGLGEAMHRARSRAERLRRNQAALEQEARQVIETANEGIWILNREGQVIMLNPRLCEMLGYPAEEVLGRCKWDFMFKEDVPRGKELFARRCRGISERVDVRFRSKSGKEVWTLMAARPRYDAQGKFSGVLDMLTDITDRRQAEQILRESEAMLRMGQDAGRIGTFDWDIQAGWAHCSEAFFKVFGLPYGEAVLKRTEWEKYLHPEDRPAVLEHLARALEGKEPCTTEYRIIRPDGQVRWIHYAGQLIPGPDGRPARMNGTITDITDSKLRQQQLEKIVAERTARLRDMIGELEIFSYSIAHDMRAPLRAMQGLSKAVLEDYAHLLPEQGREYLQRIAESSNRLDRQILDVLKYSLLVRGELPMESVDVGHLIDEIITSSPDIRSAREAIQVQSPLPPVHANRAALSQVVSNLLTNAIKFVPPGRPPKVRIWAEPNGSTVRLWFKDNGIGIPRKSLHKIFGIFQRLHSPDLYDGTGIGLAIVKKATERMGGQVGVESDPGQGSRFWISLPLAQTPLAEAA